MPVQARSIDAGVLRTTEATRPRPSGGLGSRLRSVLGGSGAERVGRILWPVADQGIASLGSFLLTIALARTLTPGEYGTFALILGVQMLLYTAISSILFYPLSVLSNVCEGAGGVPLMRASLILLAILCVPAVVCLAAVGAMLGRIDLVLPVCIQFVAWQSQEAFRRCLFAELRFAAAVPGEIISYLGQLVLLLVLHRIGELTLTSALYAMAATSGLAALVQAAQSGILAPGHAGFDLRDVAGRFVRLGWWSLAGNLAAALRLQAVFWILAALSSEAVPGLLLAGINIVNILNPLIIGLSNVIPQVSARAHARGETAALRAAQPFALTGLSMAIALLSVVAACPERVLSTIYGAGSIYADLATAIRLLAGGAILSYVADMICSYFHGVCAPKQAMTANVAGMTASLVTAAPLIVGFGLNGACLAFGTANAVRVVVSSMLLHRLLARDRGTERAAPSGRAATPGVSGAP